MIELHYLVMYNVFSNRIAFLLPFGIHHKIYLGGLSVWPFAEEICCVNLYFFPIECF